MCVYIIYMTAESGRGKQKAEREKERERESERRRERSYLDNEMTMIETLSHAWQHIGLQRYKETDRRRNRRAILKGTGRHTRTGTLRLCRDQQTDRGNTPRQGETKGIGGSRSKG